MYKGRDTSGVDSLLLQARLIELQENSVAAGRGRGRGLESPNNLAAGRGRVTGTHLNLAVGIVVDSVVNSYVLPQRLVDFHKILAAPPLNPPQAPPPQGGPLWAKGPPSPTKGPLVGGSRGGAEGPFSPLAHKPLNGFELTADPNGMHKCIVEGCEEKVSSDKLAFVKHMTDFHKCNVLKVPVSCNSKRAIFKTSFKVTDYVKDKIDCKRELETMHIVETHDNFFFCKTMETMNSFTFKCYTIGDSAESECGFYCTRAFQQIGGSFEHMSCEPIISISEKSLGKRKMEEYESLFSLDKTKARILCKSVGNNSKEIVECTVKIGKLRPVHLQKKLPS